ncbi:hypothetical protein [Streptomyces sp. NPDC006610]
MTRPRRHVMPSARTHHDPIDTPVLTAPLVAARYEEEDTLL